MLAARRAGALGLGLWPGGYGKEERRNWPLPRVDEPDRPDGPPWYELGIREDR